jgi:hypothetical protein
MAQEYDNTNRGSIWPNKDKTEANPNYPDFKGELNVQGLEFWVSAWKRKPDANPKAPSLTFKIESKDQRQSSPASQGSKPEPEDFEDSIPF